MIWRIVAVVGSILLWTVVRRRAGRVAFVVPAGAGLVTLGALLDAFVAGRFGDDLVTLWVGLVVLAAVGLLIRPPWVLGQLSLVSALGGLGIFAAYFVGGLADGHGVDCWETCVPATGLEDVATLALIAAGGFFVLAWLVDGIRRAVSRRG